MPGRTWTAIGLMSGTSMDGVDAAVMVTDGEDHVAPGPHLTLPYDEEFRSDLRALVAGQGARKSVEQTLTALHAEAVSTLLASAGLARSAVDVLGFHGHTLWHDPARGRTCQIGDGGALARLTGIDTVHDFRSTDMTQGGQGAPLAPVYHQALLGGRDVPVAVLNIGGVANLTWIGGDHQDLKAFDTGPGNALIDDWMWRHQGVRCDLDGRTAASGRVAPARLARLMAHPYFASPIPKSLDRNTFAATAAEETDGLSCADGAALLAAFTVESVKHALKHLPSPPRRWIVVGGGRHNPTIMRGLRDGLGTAVVPAEDVGWSADAVEAQAFAYLAVRSRRGLAISFPGTTGARAAVIGGVFAPAPCDPAAAD